LFVLPMGGHTRIILPRGGQVLPLEISTIVHHELQALYSVTRCKKKADLSDKNKTIESQSSEHTRANFKQYLNDISKKK
jgi:hypothetical protein